MEKMWQKINDVQTLGYHKIFKKEETEAESNISNVKLFADMLLFKNSK